MLDGVVPPLLVGGGGLLLTTIRQVFVTRRGRRYFIGDALIIAAVIGLAMFLELKMGRNPTYQHGPVRVWSGDIQSDQNSQQILDPYTLTHVSSTEPPSMALRALSFGRRLSVFARPLA